MRRIAIVGNAPLQRGVASRIDAAAHVIRFNKAPGLAGRAGRRTDELYLINHGGQMAEWLADGTLHHHPALRVARQVVLPIPMLSGHLTPRQAARREANGARPIDPDRINHLHAARRTLLRAGHRVHVVGASDYRRAQRALDTTAPTGGAALYPSTGFIAIVRSVAQALRSDRIELYGFGFQGWSGHAWEAERAWVRRAALAGRLVVHDPAGGDESDGRQATSAALIPPVRAGTADASASPRPARR